MKKILFILSLLCILVGSCNVTFAYQPDWRLITGTGDMYVDAKSIEYDKRYNHITCATGTYIGPKKEMFLILGERYFYNNKTNAIFAEMLQYKGKVVSQKGFEKNQIKAEPIKLGSDIERTYYFIYDLAKKQGKL